MEHSYTPLQNPNSIRLLHLGSGCRSSPLKAHLINCDLDNKYSYESLSYVWGKQDLSEVLLIVGREFKISKNLHTILLHLRQPDKVRILWIDAICINQQDSAEKGKQVAMMGQIYQQAGSVLCWLGE
ncbi:HET-domain-containing protein, partial [Stipitochalara longipes BDJ]